ncbi:MAG TPA: carboxypeptidase-like regulatory domain-containing protein [Planctomycetota bacterium]|nr:carboxypeptidase-like regulatory domain-containing protein [Planctomycetota bacterium]
MRSPARLALAAAALAAGLALVWALRGLREGERGSAAAAPVLEQAAEPNRPQAELAIPSPATPLAREVAQVAPEASASEPSSASAISLATADGRFVDPAGIPVEGVRVTRTRSNAEPVTSAADGSFTWTQDLGELPVRRQALQALHPGFARRSIDAVLRRGESVHLGTIVLDWGGSVSGRVVDATGNLMVKARVACTLGEQSYSEWERGQGPSNSLADTESAADGSFVLESLPPGPMRVWAGAEGMQYALSDVVTVRAGRETAGVELVLEPLDPEDTVEVLVQDPEGAPVPRARIQYSYKTVNMSGTGTTSADENGRWYYRLAARTPHELIASDPERRYTDASGTVEPGARGQVIRLGELQTIELAVSDESGAPIERWTATARPPDRPGATLGEPTRSKVGSGGVGRMPVPPLPFLLHVEAENHDVTELGPFDPARAPERLEVRLAALPGVTGRVLAGGKPVAGASVGLHDAVGDEQRLTVNGFPARSQRSAKASATTDADGTFRLTLRESGRYYVRASRSGYAPAEIGPFEMAPRPGLHGLELELREGGSIEGRVLLPGGEDAAGTIVGISRGDGHPVTQIAGAGGSFRFDGLTAGPWRVERRREEIRDGSWSSSTSSGRAKPRDMRWNCTVRNGETTRFDLDLRFDVPAVLSGRLFLGGKAPSGWMANLHSEGQNHVSAPIGPDGTFRLQSGEPGECDLSLLGEVAGEELRLYGTLDLAPGETPWAADVALGRVEGQVVEPLGEDRLRFIWQGAGDLRARVAIRPDAQGRFALAAVPAGAARIVRWSEAKGSQETAVQVPPGGMVQVQVP